MIAPIPTDYQGYSFRSRLEARWAVFFTNLGIEFEYEAEGYQFGGTRYLPDFWLPKHQCFIEIKPVDPTVEEVGRCARLARETGLNVYIAFGNIPFPTRAGGFQNDSMYCYFGRKSERCHLWCECTVCKSLGITYQGRSARLPCGCLKKQFSATDSMVSWGTDRLFNAYHRARGAQFEFGRSG